MSTTLSWNLGSKRRSSNAVVLDVPEVMCIVEDALDVEFTPTELPTLQELYDVLSSVQHIALF